ncbi:hypothetical protein BC826DRAFT_1179012 [Russula brevipes]|nr:hypothetical protein BC826DRAFT_1179012 [Russula brevipes]
MGNCCAGGTTPPSDTVLSPAAAVNDTPHARAGHHPQPQQTPTPSSSHVAPPLPNNTERPVHRTAQNRRETAPSQGRAVEPAPAPYPQSSQVYGEGSSSAQPSRGHPSPPPSRPGRDASVQPTPHAPSSFRRAYASGVGDPPPLARSRSVDTQARQEGPARRPGKLSRAASGSFLDSAQPPDSRVARPPAGTSQRPLQLDLETIRARDMDSEGRPHLKATVQSVLSGVSRFRILVIGKRNSGKSSLIKAVFKVDMSVAPGATGINEFRPRDNRRVIICESFGLEPGDLPTVRHFIATRTHPSCPASERLHAIWVCVPTSDVIAGNLGDGVKELLGIHGVSVPTVFVTTKVDLVISEAPSSHAGGDAQNYERVKATVRARYEESCRTLSRKNTRNVPVEMVSARPAFRNLIDSLTGTTDRAIVTHPCNAPASSEARNAHAQISPVLLAWSASQRTSRDIIVRAAIEVGRSRYWRGLGSSEYFSGRKQANCLEVIRADIVDIWNLSDKDKYLSSKAFKDEISYLVQELSGSPAYPLSTATAAAWLEDPYQNNQENICCVMGYIVDLSVILCGIFASVGDVSPFGVQSVIKEFVDSGRKANIHTEIRGFRWSYNNSRIGATGRLTLPTFDAVQNAVSISSEAKSPLLPHSLN